MEDRVLTMLSESTGNILDNEELISKLETAKKTSAVVKVRIEEGEKTNVEISKTRVRVIATCCVWCWLLLWGATWEYRTNDAILHMLGSRVGSDTRFFGRSMLTLSLLMFRKFTAPWPLEAVCCILPSLCWPAWTACTSIPCNSFKNCT